jgi:hypothetical protein
MPVLTLRCLVELWGVVALGRLGASARSQRRDSTAMLGAPAVRRGN